MSTSLRFGLKPEVIEKVCQVLSEYPEIQRTLVYGSRAKGNFRQGSDIDLVLDAPALTTTKLLKIENQIDDLMLPYKFDISLLHQIENPSLLEHIQRVGQEFAC